MFFISFRANTSQPCQSVTGLLPCLSEFLKEPMIRTYHALIDFFMHIFAKAMLPQCNVKQCQMVTIKRAIRTWRPFEFGPHEIQSKQRRENQKKKVKLAFRMWPVVWSREESCCLCMLLFCFICMCKQGIVFLNLTKIESLAFYYLIKSIFLPVNGSN